MAGFATGFVVAFNSLMHTYRIEGEAYLLAGLFLRLALGQDFNGAMDASISEAEMVLVMDVYLGTHWSIDRWPSFPIYQGQAHAQGRTPGEDVRVNAQGRSASADIRPMLDPKVHHLTC